MRAEIPRRWSWHRLFLPAFLAFPALCDAAAEGLGPELTASIQQLRHVVGFWNVTTTQYGQDGGVARKVEGTYEFDWLVPDRVISGRSKVPELDQASGILFYVNERRSTIEMVSVGADGHLWVMTGPAGGETRTTPPTPMSDGSMMQLRFTRFNVERDCFESRMEWSTDGGESWNPGNHQHFVRARGESGGAAGLRYRKRSQNYVPLT